MARHVTRKERRRAAGRATARLAVLTFAVASAAACAGMPRADVVPSPDGGPHRLRFADGQVSLNDQCMIQLANGLNPAIPPLYVNGRPVGFC